MSRLAKLFLILCALAFIYIGLATFHDPVADCQRRPCFVVIFENYNFGTEAEAGPEDDL